MYVKRSLWMRLNDIVDLIPVCQKGENTEDDIFTRAEREYCANRLRCLGARYLIKKCVLDYLTNQRGYPISNYRDIEVVNNELGQPLLRLFSGVRDCMNHLKIRDISISISHSKHWIAGMVLFCYE